MDVRLVSNRLRRPHAFRQSVLTPYQIIYSYQVTRFSCRPLLWSPFSHLCYRSYLCNSPHADRGAGCISTRAKRVEWLQGLSRLASSQERSSRTVRYRPTCLLFLKGAMARVTEKTIVMIIEPQRIVTNPAGERCQASGLAVRDFGGITMIMIESCAEITRPLRAPRDRPGRMHHCTSAQGQCPAAILATPMSARHWVGGNGTCRMR